jgi:DNA-binding Lrp family transcriptional regulator
MKLDKLDLAVLSQMRDNCRITYKELSKKVGSNINTVASRIKKLEKNGYIIGYSTHIDYEKIGFTTSALLQIVLDKVESLNTEKLSDILLMPETVLAYGMTGSFDVNLLVQAKNFEDLIEKIGNVGQNKHLVNLNSQFIIKEYKVIDEFNPLNPEPKQYSVIKQRRKPLDELDLAILRELRQGANKPLREFSAKLNAPISTIKERTDRMEYNGIIKGYFAKINFNKMGYWGYGLISIKLNTENINDETIVANLLKIPEIGALFRTLGRYDIHAGIIAKDVDHSLEVLKKISSISGVKSAESQVALKLLKSRTQYNPLSSFRMNKE